MDPFAVNNLKYILFIFCSIIVQVGLSQDKDIPFDKRIFTDDKDGFEEAVKEIRTGDSYFYDRHDELVEEALSHYMNAQAFNPYSSVLN